jgi:hypothetical protein
MPVQHGSPSSKGQPLEEDTEDAECIMCSPVFHGGLSTSPIARIEDNAEGSFLRQDGVAMLMANAWLSHNIISPNSYRLASTMELAGKQKSPKLDMSKDQNHDAIEAECDVLAAIGSQLEDEDQIYFDFVSSR